MKILVTNYTFDASEQTVTFTDYNPVVIERLYMIVNVVDNIIIYNFADATKGGTAATNVVTLTYDTTSMADADELMIIYDDAATSQLVDLGSNNDITLATLPDTAGGDLASMESLLTTIDGDTANISSDTASIDGKITACNTGAIAGTVTANLSATDNAVLDNIDTNTSNSATSLSVLDDWDDSNYCNVNVNLAGTDMTAGAGAVAAGTPRMTLASDDPAVALLGTIDADTSNIATSLGNMDNAVDGNYLNVNMNIAGTDVAANAGTLNAQTLRVTIATDDEVNNLLGTIDSDTSSLAGCVGGTEVQVDVVGSLPAGTNAIGKLSANSGVDIGDVDVTSMPGTGVEDAAETAGGVLHMVGTVRRDTAASSSGTSGDNSTLNTDSLGRLWISGAAVEDAAETAGGILLMMGAVRRDTCASSSGTSGDNSTINTDANGAVWTNDVNNNITGIGHGVKTVTTAGTDVALAASTTCKRVIIQSQTDNTNLIAVGGSGVDATEATGTGVVLYPGDSVELTIDNLADVYIDSLVNGEGVRFIYFT